MEHATEEHNSIPDVDELQYKKHVLFIKSEIFDEDYESLNNKYKDDLKIKVDDYDIDIKNELRNNLLRDCAADDFVSAHNDDVKPTDVSRANSRNLSDNAGSSCYSQLKVPYENKINTDEDSSTSQQKTNGSRTKRKYYKCDACEKIFNRPAELVKHKRIHTGEKPYVCDVCDAKFSQHGNLVRHNRTHTGDKPYVCNVCNKAFHQSYLELHKRIHTGEKPHICDICQKTFSTSGNFKVHQRIHTGLKPHVCDVCEKSFTKSAYLKRHLRTHTGDKGYVCDVCQKTFSTRSKLKVHLRTHTDR